MGTIRLRDISIYGFHGCLMEEGIIGSEYLIDLDIFTNLNESIKSDNLENTVDYCQLYEIVTKEMETKSKLIESVAGRIVNSIFDSYSSVTRVLIELKKINPPIGGKVRYVSVVLDKNSKI